MEICWVFFFSNHQGEFYLRVSFTKAVSVIIRVISRLTHFPIFHIKVVYAHLFRFLFHFHQSQLAKPLKYFHGENRIHSLPAYLYLYSFFFHWGRLHRQGKLVSVWKIMLIIFSRFPNSFFFKIWASCEIISFPLSSILRMEGGGEESCKIF